MMTSNYHDSEPLFRHNSLNYLPVLYLYMSFISQHNINYQFYQEAFKICFEKNILTHTKETHKTFDIFSLVTPRQYLIA